MASLLPLVRQARETLFSAKDSVCLDRARLVTEAYQMHEELPVPLKRAHAFRHVLRNMQLDLDSNPVFAGNMSSRPRGWMLIPEHGMRMGDSQVVIENPDLKDFLEGKIPPELAEFWKGRSFGGSAAVGHLAVDMNRVVHEGLDALLEETRQFEKETDLAKRVYREAMAICLEAVIEWSARYAEAAEAAAAAAEDPALRAVHLRVAEACRRVPAKPARNLFEGLQAMALIHLAIQIEGHGMSVSIGLPDRVLAPFITANFDSREAAELIAAFMLKISANAFLGRAYKSQTLTVGGLNHLREDQCNELTLCFLEACELARVGDPPLFLRWHEKIDERVKHRAAELLASGLSMPLLIHDEPTARGFIEAGVRPEDAWDYCVVGCNELAIPGRSADSATCRHGLIQHLGVLNNVLLNHPEPDTILSTSELVSLMERALEEQMEQGRVRGEKHRARCIEQVPTPFTSALMNGCLPRGKDLLEGMDYHFPSHYERGLSNAANALAAIDELVFQQRALKLSEIVQAMRDNFQDNALRLRLLSQPKWGNDDERADRWGLELLEMRERVLNRVDQRHGARTHFVCHVVRSLHYVDGRQIAASPDGRYAWAPVADSVGAQGGTAAAGPTALLNSVARIHAPRYYRGGYNLNLTLPKMGTREETLLPLLESFFGRGGQELQVNSFDAATLRAAQKEPEKYEDLVVRVAGLSARFIDLSTVEQEELIARAEAAA